jgi:predicted RNA-binding Zn ribbon-like protein
MANSQSLICWQEAEAAAEAAHAAVSDAIRAGRRPSQEQLDDVIALRSIASQRLKEMVADMKAQTSLQ